MNQRILISIALAAGLTGGCSGGAGSAGGMQAGKWTMTTEVLDMKVKGMPAGMAMPKPAPVTTSMCITADQAGAGPGGMMAKSTPGCTVSKSENSGGKLALEMSCQSAAGTVSTKVDGTYSPTEYTLNSEASTSGDHATTTKSRITAKRVGECGQ
jgi:hypothetical protein